MRQVLPHESFRIDFDAVLEDAKRQEGVGSSNIGEYAIAKGMHTYFDEKVLPIIASDDWVFGAAYNEPQKLDHKLRWKEV